MPQSMRYHLLGAQAGDKIRIDTWYAKPQRLDVYYKVCSARVPEITMSLTGEKLYLIPSLQTIIIALNY